MNARVFLCLMTAVICSAAPLAAQNAQQQQTDYQAPVVRVIALKNADCQEAHSVVAALMRDVRVAVDPRTNSIIVSGPKDAVDEVERFVGELDQSKAQPAKPKVAPEEKSRYRLTLYFVAGDFEPKDREKLGVPIPAPVKPAAKVLEDAGLANLSLITTMMASAQETAQFESEGSWPTEANVYRLRTRGSLFANPNSSAVSLELDSELFQAVYEKQGTRTLRMSNESVFKFSSTILTNPGEYVVVGSSPAASGIGDAIALIVMVQQARIESH